MSSNSLRLCLLAACGLAACTRAPLRPTGPAERVVARLVAAVEARDGERLARLMTPHCRQGCVGFAPRVLSSSSGYQVARWVPRLGGGSMLHDLSLALASMGTVRRFEIVPLRRRQFHRRAFVRARLVAWGRDGAGVSRIDDGVIDLELVRRSAGWRIDRLQPAMMHTVRRVDRTYVAAPGAVDGAEGVDERAPWVAIDVDGDHAIDLVSAHRDQLQVMRRDGATWAAPRTLATTGVPRPTVLVAADIDGDGLGDLFVGGDRGGRVLVNRPGGWQTLLRIDRPVRAALFADLDADGALDLFVGAGHGDGRHDAIYFGGGDGRFQRADRPARPGGSSSVCAGDFDGDGRVDLVAVGRQRRLRLWHNRGARRFRDVAGRSGLLAGAPARRCVVGDVDGDRRLDVVLVGPRSAVWLNRSSVGRPRFIGRAFAGPRWPGWVGLFDHDNDGQLDLLTRGRIVAVGGASDQVFLNAGEGRLVEVTPLVSLPPAEGRDAIVLDADGDGALDLLRGGELARWVGGHEGVGEDEEDPDGGALRSLTLRLVSRAPGNRDAFGAVVEVRLERGRRRLAVVGHASGIAGGAPGYVHVGVGRALRVPAVRVTWPDGTRETVDDLPVDRVVWLRQGEPPDWREPVELAPTSQPASQPTSQPASQPTSAPASQPDRLEWTPPPATAPGAAWSRFGAANQSALRQLAGERATVMLVAPEKCPGCARACGTLRRWVARRPGVAAVALVVGRSLARCALPQHSLDAQTARSLAPVLPATVLVDGQGQTIRINAGLPTRQRLEADLAQLPSP